MFKNFSFCLIISLSNAFSNFEKTNESSETQPQNEDNPITTIQALASITYDNLKMRAALERIELDQIKSEWVNFKNSNENLLKNLQENDIKQNNEIIDLKKEISDLKLENDKRKNKYSSDLGHFKNIIIHQRRTFQETVNRERQGFQTTLNEERQGFLENMQAKEDMIRQQNNELLTLKNEVINLSKNVTETDIRINRKFDEDTEQLEANMHNFQDQIELENANFQVNVTKKLEKINDDKVDTESFLRSLPFIFDFYTQTNIYSDSLLTDMTELSNEIISKNKETISGKVTCNENSYSHDSSIITVKDTWTKATFYENMMSPTTPVTCLHKLQAPENHRIQLFIADVNSESNCDKYSFFEGGTRTNLNGSIGQWSASSKTPKLLISKSNSIDIEFKSDSGTGHKDTLIIYYQSIKPDFLFYLE